jgi:F5/8 type C domain
MRRRMRSVALAVAVVIASASISAGPAAADPINDSTVYWTATCTGLGDVTLAWMLWPSPNARGASSAMQVVGANTVVIIYTGASERIGQARGTSCTFWSGEGLPYPGLTEWVMIVPGTENLALDKPTTASATVSYAGYDSSMAVDGNPWTFWNSGDFAPQWIEIDLGQSYAVFGVSLWVTMLPDGYTSHSVWVRTERGQWAEWAVPWSFEGDTVDLQRLTAWGVKGPATARYVRIVSNVSPSWIAWREVEVYGRAATGA